MSATVYQRVCLKKNEFSRKDLRRIANWINSIYKKDHEEDPPKVEQQEGELTFMVFSYPDEMIPQMDMIVDKFFKNKTITAERHNDYLVELAKCKETGKPIKPQEKSRPERKGGKPAGGNFNKGGSKFGDKGSSKFGDRGSSKFGDKGGSKFGDKHGNFHKDRPNFSHDNRERKPIEVVEKVGFRSEKPAMKNDIPVATTLRKRKTAPGAVSTNDQDK